MAGKSLLSRLGKKKGSYSVEKHAKKTQNSGKVNVLNAVSSMAGRYSSSSSNSSSSNTGAPPPKKRRTEERHEDEGEGLWDDSLELTQADFDDLEIQASQAYDKPIPGPSSKQPTGAQPRASSSRMGHLSLSRELDTSGQFVKPTLRKSSSSSVSHSSSLHDQSSDTSHAYPSSLSGYTSQSSSSIKSGSSAEVQIGQPRNQGSVSRGISSESLDISTMPSFLSRNTASTDSTGDDLERLRKRLNLLKDELDNKEIENKRLKDEISANQGEVRVLRDNLHKRDSEIDQLKSDKVSMVVKQSQEQTEKEKSYTAEIAKLKTQLQFKEQEQRNLEEQLRALRGTLVPSQGSVSPKPTRVMVEERSPKGSQGFPTKKAFMAAEGSPRKQARSEERALSLSPARRKEVTQFGDSGKVSKAKKERKWQLSVPQNERVVTGSKLHASLMEVGPSVGEMGLVGLLRTSLALPNLHSLQYNRDQNSSLLSPVRNRRLSEVRALSENQQRSSCVNIVSDQDLRLAMRGLASLQNDSIVTTPSGSALGPGGDNYEQRTVTHEPVLLVLPLLNSYLCHYLDMLSASVLNLSVTVTSPSTSSSSSSFDSSVDSLTGSLGMLVRDSATYANNLEQAARTALLTLLKMVRTCPYVRHVLLHKPDVEVITAVEDRGTPTVQTDSSKSSDSPGSEESPTTQGHGFPTVHSWTMKHIQRLLILHKIFKLANPGTKSSLYNVNVVKLALCILAELSTDLTEQQVQSLLPVLHEEVIQNCLECDADPVLPLHALHLLTVLSKYNAVVSSFCSVQGCILRCVYKVCSDSNKYASFDRDTRLQIFQKVLEFLSCVIGEHRGGVTVLLESDCSCSLDVVSSVILLMHNVMQAHLEKSKPTSLQILQKGLLLLHILCRHDNSFQDHHSDVQHQYVGLICGLTQIIKTELPSSNDNELSALSDLWDFNQDDSELLQDSDEEHSMEEN